MANLDSCGSKESVRGMEDLVDANETMTDGDKEQHALALLSSTATPAPRALHPGYGAFDNDTVLFQVLAEVRHQTHLLSLAHTELYDRQNQAEEEFRRLMDAQLHAYSVAQRSAEERFEQAHALSTSESHHYAQTLVKSCVHEHVNCTQRMFEDHLENLLKNGEVRLKNEFQHFLKINEGANAEMHRILDARLEQEVADSVAQLLDHTNERITVHSEKQLSESLRIIDGQLEEFRAENQRQTDFGERLSSVESELHRLIEPQSRIYQSIKLILGVHLDEAIDQSRAQMQEHAETLIKQISSMHQEDTRGMIVEYLEHFVSETRAQLKSHEIQSLASIEQRSEQQCVEAQCFVETKIEKHLCEKKARGEQRTLDNHQELIDQYAQDNQRWIDNILMEIQKQVQVQVVDAANAQSKTLIAAAEQKLDVRMRQMLQETLVKVTAQAKQDVSEQLISHEMAVKQTIHEQIHHEVVMLHAKSELAAADLAKATAVEIEERVMTAITALETKIQGLLPSSLNSTGFTARLQESTRDVELTYGDGVTYMHCEDDKYDGEGRLVIDTTGVEKRLRIQEEEKALVCRSNLIGETRINEESANIHATVESTNRFERTELQRTDEDIDLVVEARMRESLMNARTGNSTQHTTIQNPKKLYPDTRRKFKSQFSSSVSTDSSENEEKEVIGMRRREPSKYSHHKRFHPVAENQQQLVANSSNHPRHQSKPSSTKSRSCIREASADAQAQINQQVENSIRRITSLCKKQNFQGMQSRFMKYRREVKSSSKKPKTNPNFCTKSLVRQASAEEQSKIQMRVEATIKERKEKNETYCQQLNGVKKGSSRYWIPFDHK